MSKNFGIRRAFVIEQMQCSIAAIKERKNEMDGIDAKIFLDDLNFLTEQLVVTEIEWIQYDKNSHDFVRSSANYKYPQLQTSEYRKKLAKIISDRSTKSSASDEINLNNPSNQCNESKPAPDSDLQSRIQKQKFLIEQIEGVQIDEDVCAVKAQVLYDHVGILYEWFVSNQVQIDAEVVETALVDQQKIASQTRQKLIEIQTRLKKIITPNVPVSNAKTESESSNQFHQNQTDRSSDLNSLLKKENLFINQILSLEEETTTSDLCADKAKVTCDHLSAVYEMFVSNHLKIEEQMEGATLDIRQEISKMSTEIQHKIIQLQTNLKKIFDPAPAPSFVDPNQKELETVNNLINLFHEFLYSSQNKFGPEQFINESCSTRTFSSSSSSTPLTDDDHSEVFRFAPTPNTVASLSTNLNEIKELWKSRRPRRAHGNANSTTLNGSQNARYPQPPATIPPTIPPTSQSYNMSVVQPPRPFPIRKHQKQCDAECFPKASPINDVQRDLVRRMDPSRSDKELDNFLDFLRDGN